LTTYATIKANGQKNRLRMKKPMKLWPLRLATRAGQNARAIQMIAEMIQTMVRIPTSGQMVTGRTCCAES
jgi:hypothetical protein